MGQRFYQTCTCCGHSFDFVGTHEMPERCSLCEHRDGMCQHNLFERVTAGGENLAHASKACWWVGRECEWVELVDGEIRRKAGEQVG